MVQMPEHIGGDDTLGGQDGSDTHHEHLGAAHFSKVTGADMVHMAYEVAHRRSRRWWPATWARRRSCRGSSLTRRST